MSQDFFAGQGYGKVHVHYFTGSLDGDHVGRRQQAWIDTRRPRSTLPLGGKPRPTLGRGQVWAVQISGYLLLKSGCPLLMLFFIDALTARPEWASPSGASEISRFSRVKLLDMLRVSETASAFDDLR